MRVVDDSGVVDDGLWHWWRDRRGYRMWQQWAPETCRRCGEPIRPGQVRVGWRPCNCPGVGEGGGGHATWMHWACGAVMVWQPCSGPGAEPNDMPILTAEEISPSGS